MPGIKQTKKPQPTPKTNNKPRMKRDLGLLISFHENILSYTANTDQHSEVTKTPLDHGLKMSVKDAEYPLLSLATVGMELSIAKLRRDRIVSQHFNLFANHLTKSRQQPHPIVMLLHKTVLNECLAVPLRGWRGNPQFIVSLPLPVLAL